MSDEAAVNRVGEALNQTLEADRQVPPRDHFSPVQVRFPVNAPPLRPPAAAAAEEAVVMVDFDAENGVDGDKAQEHARSIRVEFNASKIGFWFSELEGEMVMASVKSQWLKRTVLQRNLPTKQKEDVMALLTLSKTEGGNDIY